MKIDYTLMNRKHCEITYQTIYFCVICETIIVCFCLQIFDSIIPCSIITPLDCFWEGSKLLGPEYPVHIVK